MICQRSVGEKRLLSAARGAPSSFNQPSAAWCGVNHLWTAAGGSEHQSAPLMTAGSQPSIPGAGLEPLINLTIPAGREDELVLSRAVPWAVSSSDTVARLCLPGAHSPSASQSALHMDGNRPSSHRSQKPQIVNRHPFCTDHSTKQALPPSQSHPASSAALRHSTRHMHGPPGAGSERCQRAVGDAAARQPAVSPIGRSFNA